MIVSSACERAAEKRGVGRWPLTLSTDVAERLPRVETLEVTERTVQRLWLKARLMLRAAME